MPCDRKHVLWKWWNQSFSSNEFHSLSFASADGCELVLNKIGVGILFDICRYACQRPDNTQLRMIILGALHNIINSNGKYKLKLVGLNWFILFLKKKSQKWYSRKIYSKFFFYLFHIYRNREFYCFCFQFVQIWPNTTQVWGKRKARNWFIIHL